MGYNDDDPKNPYWIMVNSWGTAEGGRPNGIFRLDMDMDYGCSFSDGEHSSPSYFWQTLGVNFNMGGQVIYVERSGDCGGRTPCYTTIQAAINDALSGSTIKVAGGSYGEDVRLNTDKDLIFEGGYNSTFSTQSKETILRTMTFSNGRSVVDKLTLGSPEPVEVASVVFYNALVCEEDPFTATLTIDGKVLTSRSGQYSDCEDLDCGTSLNWEVYLSTPCGTVTISSSKILDCECLYKFLLGLDDGLPEVFIYKNCPGDCSDVSSVFIGSMELLNSVVLIEDADFFSLAGSKEMGYALKD